MKKLFVLALLFIVAGCINTAQLKKAGNVKPWNSYSVALSEDINEYRQSETIIWTRYSVGLERVDFMKPVKDGGKIPFAIAPQKSEPAPKYRKDMTPEEIAEFVRDSIAYANSIPQEWTDLRPASFGTKQGYAFNMEFSNAEGDDYKAEFLFTTEMGHLDMIVFHGRRLHYYDHRKPFFDGIVSSLQY